MKLNKVGKKSQSDSKKGSLNSTVSESKKGVVKIEPKSEVLDSEPQQKGNNKRKFSKAFAAEKNDVPESQVKINNKAKNKKNKSLKNGPADDISEETLPKLTNDETTKAPKNKKRKKNQQPNKPDVSENELKPEPKVNDAAKVPKKKKKKSEAAGGSITKTDGKKNPTNGAETPKKVVKITEENKDSRDSRTVFVGNLPIKFNKKKLAKLFKKCGDIEKLWTRGVIPDNDKISKKVAFAKKLFHKDQLSLVSYILFKTAEDAQKALTLNGELFDDRHLRVCISSDKSFDKDKGVFVGNLPFNVTDDEVWELFKNCGEILTVRIIRDLKSGLGKGFGYVNFKSADAVELALQLNDEEIHERQIRVKRLINEGQRKKLNKKKLLRDASNSKPTGSKKPITKKTVTDGGKPKIKKKKNKAELKKKELAEKLLAKPKKKKEKEISSS